MVLGMRALRPEQLSHLTPDQFEQALRRFAELKVSWLPSSWAGEAVWSALKGQLSWSAVVLA